MLFFFGIIVGLLIAIFVFSVIAFFRLAFERTTRKIAMKIADAGMKPRGFIYEPEDEAGEARKEMIDKNRAEGKDTPIEDLYDHDSHL